MANLACYAGKCNRGVSVFCLTALSGILAPVIFILLMVTIESIQPGYSPVRDTISGLVIGFDGWVQNFGFFLFGFLFMVFSLRLYASTNRQATSLIGMIFFLMAGLGFFAVGAFPMTENAVRWHAIRPVHVTAAISTVSFFILGCFAYTVDFGKDSPWHKYRRFTALTAVISLIFMAFWIAAPVSWGLRGLFERLVALAGFPWIEIVSIRLFRYCIHKNTQKEELPVQVKN